MLHSHKGCVLRLIRVAIMARNSKGGWLLYVMVHFPLIIFFKVGITSLSIGAKGRAKSIDREMPGRPIPIFFLPLPGAYKVEQELHRILKSTNVVFYKGSGCTEWFLLSPLFVVLPIMIMIWAGYLWLADCFFGTQILPFLAKRFFYALFWICRVC